MIRFTTLGSVDLRGLAGQQVVPILAQPKRLALLAYLATVPSTLKRQGDTVRAMFWPEYDEPRARHALNQALYALRRELGSAVIVSTRGGELRVAPGEFWCDAVAFRTALETDRPEVALELYRGDLLPGLFVSGSPAFEHWLDAERDQLRRMAAAAAWQLSATAEAEGRVETAVWWGRRGMTLSPYDELAVRRVLALMDRLGDRAGAIETYQAFAADVRAELDVSPSPETRRLVAEIRSRDSISVPFAADSHSPRSRAATDPVHELAHVGTIPVADSPSRRIPRVLRTVAASAAAVILLLMSGGHGFDRHPGETRLSTSVPDAGGMGRAAVTAPAAWSRGTDSAQVLYQLGRLRLERRSSDDLDAARIYFEEAIHQDSTFAIAYSGLAEAYALLTWYSPAARPEAIPKARAAARHALDLNDGLSEAHTSWAAVLAWMDRNGQGAEKEYQRAIALDPRNATAHEWYAFALAERSRLGPAIAEARWALDIDPQSPAINADLATLLYWNGQYNEAISQWQHTLDLSPGFRRADNQLWHAYAAAGRYADAVRALEQLGRRQGMHAADLRALERAYAEDGWRGVLTWRLQALVVAADREPGLTIQIATLCAELGRPGAALMWLRRARDEHNQFLPYAALDPAFTALRTDPRFPALFAAASSG
jgi:DNA-binding SARP family transcriptional activator